jgi:hypothetical protein
MARTIEVIQQQIIDNLAIGGILVSSDKFSRRRIWTYVVAYCIWILENIMDVFKSEINETIAQRKPHTKNWYKNTVLSYLHGFVVDASTLQYNLTGVSDAAIEAARIVKYCAVDDGNDSLNVKVAKETGGVLEPLTPGELAGLKSYMEDDQLGQKDAGVFLNFINDNADELLLKYDVYVNPSVIDDTGVHILSGVKTVEVAINNFLESLEFNGVFATQNLEIEIRKNVEGVELMKLRLCQVRAAGESLWNTLDVQYLPNSGYLKFINTNDLELNYLPY